LANILLEVLILKINHSHKYQKDGHVFRDFSNVTQKAFKLSSVEMNFFKSNKTQRFLHNFKIAQTCS